MLQGLVLEPTEHSLTLNAWPKVGGVDLAIDVPSGSPVLIELKWGAGTLYNCAWDAVKLATALGEHAASAAFMVAGAPTSDWSPGTPGSDLFADADWDTTDFMERHASSFASWRQEVTTRPKMLPAAFCTSRATKCPVPIEGAQWDLRCVEIALPSGSGWVVIDSDGHAVMANS
jgi:hypothetical protein